MLGEVTHLQAIVDDLTVLTEDPHKLPPASEQVIHFRLIILPATMTKHYKNMWRWMALFHYSSCSVFPAACPKFLICNCHMSLQVIRDLKGSDYSWSYQTPPSSPSSTGSRKSSMCRYSPISHTHTHTYQDLSQYFVNGGYNSRCLCPEMHGPNFYPYIFSDMISHNHLHCRHTCRHTLTHVHVEPDSHRPSSRSTRLSTFALGRFAVLKLLTARLGPELWKWQQERVWKLLLETNVWPI